MFYVPEMQLSQNFPNQAESTCQNFEGQGACPRIDPDVPAQDKMAEGPKPFGT